MAIDAIVNMVVELGFVEIGVMSEHIENYLGAPVQLPGAGRAGGRGETRGKRLVGTPHRGRNRGAKRCRRRGAEAGGRSRRYGLTFDDTFTDDEKAMSM